MGHKLDGSECGFSEVEILSDDEYSHLKAGMKVLVPCSCGDTPLESMEFLQGLVNEYQDTLAKVEPRRALFHWSPRERRNGILRYGLVPGKKETSSTGRYNCVCFADSPSWAWALSGEMRWTPSGVWDLWQTSLDLLTEPVILPGAERSSGIYEVRTEHRVYKRDLWYVGSREKR